jgi:hypothetical protein
MKKVIKYQCEICYNFYDNEDEALACENQGVEKPLAKLYDHVSFRDDWNGGFDPAWYGLQVVNIKEGSHEVVYELGLVFDEETGDLTHDEYIYGNNEFKDKCKLI